MARSTTTIYNTAVAQYVANATAAGVSPVPNPAAADIENTVALASPQTALWMQNFVLNIFQYNTTIPQIIQFNTTTFAPYYPTINPAYRIATQCVVVPGSYGSTTIQVAKTVAGVYQRLTHGMPDDTTNELAALQSTLNAVAVPGIYITVVSNNADKIYINGTVTYNGQYSAVIPVTNGTVVQAIQAYLSSIPTSGVAGVGSLVGLMKLSDLIAAVRAVPGVIDFELNNVNARADINPFVPGIYNMVSATLPGGPYAWIMSEWNSGFSGAGYMVTETTTGQQINDSLTYTAI